MSVNFPFLFPKTLFKNEYAFSMYWSWAPGLYFTPACARYSRHAVVYVIYVFLSTQLEGKSSFLIHQSGFGGGGGWGVNGVNREIGAFQYTSALKLKMLFIEKSDRN